MSKNRKKLDLGEIEQLAFLGCSVQEIAVYIGRNEAALEKSRRCIRAITMGWARFNITLRQRMLKLAVGGDLTLLVLLHNNPPPLNRLCVQYEELNKERRFNRMATDREEIQRMLRSGFLERERPADSHGGSDDGSQWSKVGL
jgi:hypothetical protein